MTNDHEQEFAAQVDAWLDGQPEHGLPPEDVALYTQLRQARPVADETFATSLRARLAGQSQEQITMKRPTLRFSTRIILIAAAILVIAVVAYAVDFALKQVIDMDAGLSFIDDAELGTELNLSQTRDNLTVTVQWAYADDSRISIGYVMSGDGPLDSPASDYYPLNYTLRDDAGHVFESAGGMGYTGEGGESVSVSSFDTAALGDLPPELTLHFEVEVEIITERSRATLDARPTPAPGDPPVTYSEEEGNSPFSEPYGPFAFDFTVPTRAGRVVNIDQAVEDQGIAITLKRALISPSRTQLEVCFTPPQLTLDRWGIAANLYINGSNVFDEQITAGDDYIEGTDCRRLIYNAAFGERLGEWRLEIFELIGFTGETGADQTRIAGTWDFSFDLMAEQ
ncbi:MAG: DUF4179 domain-containing protein [Anaerolineae bacterium]|nr:DUF4179 domain-containing protein [Anaerolineae bacterium]